MSKYTTELRFICEQLAGLEKSVGYDESDSVIAVARPKIFSFEYPIFDVAYKDTIETKIIRHFYTREICAETYGRWKMFLHERMVEIMPYYNKLYESELLEFNPLYTTDLKREGNGNTNNTRTDNLKTSVNYTHKNRYSDTPQGSLQNIENNTYLTNASIDDYTGDQAINTGTQNNIGKNDYFEHVYGYSGYNPSKLLKEFRETFLNIDLMIIRELNDLFFNLW